MKFCVLFIVIQLIETVVYCVGRDGRDGIPGLPGHPGRYSLLVSLVDKSSI